MVFKNLNSTDRGIFLVAIVLLVTFSYFLYDDTILFKQKPQSSEMAIGEVYSILNDVRTRRLGDFSWLPTAHGEKLISSESIFTGANSGASIQMRDGTLVHVKPNSLIVLVMNQGQLELNLKYGDLVGEITTSSELVVRSGSEEFELKGSGSPKSNQEPASVLIQRSRAGHNLVESIKGSPRVTSKRTGKILALNKATSVPSLTTSRLLTRGLPPPIEKTKPLRLIPITKDQMIFSRVHAQETPDFKWLAEGLPPNSQFSVKIQSVTEADQEPFLSQTKLTEFKPDSPLKDSSYTWQISILDDKGTSLLQSDPFTVHIVTLAPPTWIKPQFETGKPIAVSNEQESLELEWNAGPAYVFEWQMASKPEFSKIEDQGSSDLPRVSVTKPSAGSHWIRARAQKTKPPLEVLWTPWSEVAEFRIPPPTAISLAAPVLDRRKIVISGPTARSREPASISPAQISWSQVQGADYFELEIADSTVFSNSKKVISKKNSILFNKYSDATHFFRVRAKNKAGLQSPPSLIGEIKVQLQAPEIQPIRNQIAKSEDPDAPAPLRKVPAEWSSVPLTSSYKVEISKSANFQNPLTLEVPTHQTILDIKEPGFVFTRVLPLGKNREPLTAFSKPVKFEYVFKQILRAPALAEPFNKSTIFLQEDSSPYIWLEWKIDASAEKYEIQISSDKAFKKKLIDSKSDKNRFLLKEKIPYGSIYWRVRSLHKDPDLNSKWTSPRSFDLIFKKNEGLVE